MTQDVQGRVDGHTLVVRIPMRFQRRAIESAWSQRTAVTTCWRQSPSRTNAALMLAPWQGGP
jgi:hypothetical protein